MYGIVSCYTEDLYEAVNKINTDFKDMSDQEQVIFLMTTTDDDIIKQYDFFFIPKFQEIEIILRFKLNIVKLKQCIYFVSISIFSSLS